MRKPTRISKQNKYQLEGRSYSKSCRKLHSLLQMSADFLPPFKATSKHFLLYFPRTAHPSLPRERVSLQQVACPNCQHPPEQIWVPAEDIRGLKYLFNLISYPLNTNMGIKVEILRYYFIHSSFNTFIISPRLLQSPEALKSHVSLSPSLPFAADEATARS